MLLKRSIVALLFTSGVAFATTDEPIGKPVSSYLVTESLPVSSIRGLPAVPKDVVDHANKELDQARSSLMGLTPDEIRDLKAEYASRNRAKLESVEDEPQAKSRTIPYKLNAYDQSVSLNLSPKYSTVLSVVDSTGKPWDVINVEVGNTQKFGFSRLDKPKGNILGVYTMADYKTRSNLVLLLKSPTGEGGIPVNLELLSGQKTVDGPTELRIQAVGPNGSIQKARLAQGADSKYLNWLSNVIPSNVKKLKTDDNRVKAWKDTDGSLVLITEGVSIYSPSSIMSFDSGNGLKSIYKFPGRLSVFNIEENATEIRSRVRVYDR